MSKSKASCRGGVFVELILALPILITIPFAVLELSRLLEKIQIVNVIGQETAASGYRSCVDYDDKQLKANRMEYEKKPDTRLYGRTNTCLQGIHDTFAGAGALTDSISGAFSVTISAYRYYAADDAMVVAGTEKLYRIGMVTRTPSLPNPTVRCDGVSPSVPVSIATAECGSPLIRDTATNTIVINAAGAMARERFIIVEVHYRHTAIAPFVNLIREIGGIEHGYREVTIL